MKKNKLLIITIFIIILSGCLNNNVDKVEYYCESPYILIEEDGEYYCYYEMSMLPGPFMAKEGKCAIGFRPVAYNNMYGYMCVKREYKSPLIR